MCVGVTVSLAPPTALVSGYYLWHCGQNFALSSSWLPHVNRQKMTSSTKMIHTGDVHVLCTTQQREEQMGTTGRLLQFSWDDPASCLCQLGHLHAFDWGSKPRSICDGSMSCASNAALVCDAEVCTWRYLYFH